MTSSPLYFRHDVYWETGVGVQKASAVKHLLLSFRYRVLTPFRKTFPMSSYPQSQSDGTHSR